MKCWPHRYVHFSQELAMWLLLISTPGDKLISAIPAIIIKRHRLLEHWYNTSNVYNVVPLSDWEDTYIPIPTIDQFQSLVAWALLVHMGKGTEPGFKEPGRAVMVSSKANFCSYQLWDL